MNKRKFYIYQEELIKYSIGQEPLTISQLVKDLNKRYCHKDMKKLRTETITNYLNDMGFLIVNDRDRKRPTQKGNFLGIEVGYITDKKGKEHEVNLYDERAQKYILDNLYEML